MPLHPLDALDHALERDQTIGTPLHARAAAASLANEMEFAAIRWQWHRERGEDLLDRLPRGDHDFRHLPRADADLQLAIDVRDAMRGVHPVPDLGESWEAGAPFSLFQERFKSALVAAGQPTRFAAGLAGALAEMAGNAAEHSKSPVRPAVAYEISMGRWEFCVTDVGVGALGSLRRNPKLVPFLKNDVIALQAAVRDGVSASSANGRGRGFTELFRALANRMCTIRLRSVASTTTWSGTAPGATALRISPARKRAGFHVAISGGLTGS